MINTQITTPEERAKLAIALSLTKINNKYIPRTTNSNGKDAFNKVDAFRAYTNQ
jgi:hypothetical protein